MCLMGNEHQRVMVPFLKACSPTYQQIPHKFSTFSTGKLCLTSVFRLGVSEFQTTPKKTRGIGYPALLISYHVFDSPSVAAVFFHMSGQLDGAWRSLTVAQELARIPVPGLTPLGLKSDLDHDYDILCDIYLIWRMFYFAWCESSDIGMTVWHIGIMTFWHPFEKRCISCWDEHPRSMWTLGWFEWWHSTRNGVKSNSKGGVTAVQWYRNIDLETNQISPRREAQYVTLGNEIT